MIKNLLLTSFTTWLPDQKSNSSDDLLGEISQCRDTNCISSFCHLTFLRSLPVDIELASDRVIAKINELNPDAVICCGMSRRRDYLSVESNATCENTLLYTNINIEKLLGDADKIKISHDAGKFVCEGLYYSVLKHIYDHKIKTYCVFVHVPILTEENTASVKEDFMLLVQRLYDASVAFSEALRQQS